METLAREVTENLALAAIADDKPVILDAKAKEEVTGTQACEYCGYDPCGCGG